MRCERITFLPDGETPDELTFTMTAREANAILNVLDAAAVVVRIADANMRSKEFARPLDTVTGLWLDTGMPAALTSILWFIDFATPAVHAAAAITDPSTRRKVEDGYRVLFTTTTGSFHTQPVAYGFANDFADDLRFTPGYSNISVVLV